jgi:hypothetical protein
MPMAACLMLGACASVTPPPARPNGADARATATFILVPHAETADDTADDPPLSVAGQARAEALRTALAGTPLAAIYIDEFRRTRDTVAPTLRAHRALEPARYFSRGPLRETALQWRQHFSGGTVLVVGEPDAIAPLGSGLCDCTIKPQDARDTDRMLRIERHADGSSRVDDGRYGASP